MRKPYLVGSGVVAAVLILAAVSFGKDLTGQFSLNTASAPRPGATDVQECNEYARWIAERDLPAERQAADENLPGPLMNTGTLEGLSASYQENPRAEDAYRRCMTRRGYKAWG